MSAYDAIIIGAGHNGLTTAALLARRGRRVLVLEQRDAIGGLASSDEFHPGYRGAGVHHDTTGIRRAVVQALGLERHGLRLRARRPEVLALGHEGRALLLDGNDERTARAIAQHVPADGERYLRYRAFIDRVRGVLERFLDEPPIDPTGLERRGLRDAMRGALRLRLLGKRDMLELLRLPAMCVADWLDEWFESDLLKASLALPALAGSFTGPRSPGSNLNLLLWEAGGSGVIGGGPALVAALEAAARDAGAEIRSGARAEAIVLDGSGACGVRLRGGETIPAGLVAASCDPKRTLLELLPPFSITQRLEHRIRKLRTRGTTAHMLLALSAPPRFAGLPERDVGFARTGNDLLSIERSFDAVKYRRVSDEPVLDIHVPTVDAPQLAPAGHAVVSVLVHCVPYDRDPPWDRGARERLSDSVLSILERHAPGVSSTLVASAISTPRELETRYGVSGGHTHHGEHALDQRLLRPAPGCIRYGTPVAGLFLCGSGSHPGGGLTCAPGALAAAAILAR